MVSVPVGPLFLYLYANATVVLFLCLQPSGDFIHIVELHAYAKIFCFFVYFFLVVEKPKEYICREVDIVVDHVGNVSASLDGLISQTNAFSDAELRESNASNKVGSAGIYMVIFKAIDVPIEWEEHYVETEIDPMTQIFLTW
ncbi:hypothetical protein HN51_053617 [Arachis hypogaea]